MNDFDIIKKELVFLCLHIRQTVVGLDPKCRLRSTVSVLIAGSSAASQYLSGFLPVLKECRCLAPLHLGASAFKSALSPLKLYGHSRANKSRTTAIYFLRCFRHRKKAAGVRLKMEPG